MLKISRMIMVAFLVMTSACAMLPTHKDDFTKKNEDFMLRVRWLDFPGASLHFDQEYRQEFVERFEDSDDLRITSFTMARIDINVPEEKATVHYRLEYYMLPSATIEKKKFSLTWEQPVVDSSGKAYWRITEPFPELP